MLVAGTTNLPTSMASPQLAQIAIHSHMYRIPCFQKRRSEWRRAVKQRKHELVQAPEHRPKYASDAELGGIPLIDLSQLRRLHEPTDLQGLLLPQVEGACRDWGFFQVVDHGVPPGVGSVKGVLWPGSGIRRSGGGYVATRSRLLRGREHQERSRLERGVRLRHPWARRDPLPRRRSRRPRRNAQPVAFFSAWV